MVELDGHAFQAITIFLGKAVPEIIQQVVIYLGSLLVSIFREAHFVLTVIPDDLDKFLLNLAWQ